MRTVATAAAAAAAATPRTFPNNSNSTVAVDPKVEPFKEFVVERLSTLVAVPESYIVRTDGCVPIIAPKELETDSVLAWFLDQHRELSEVRRVNETTEASNDCAALPQMRHPFW
eukprot:COSAG02_NODE_819_length_16803_cov_6.292924_4_plen_114_part_00